MLSEVMIALVISSMVIMPILDFVSNYIKLSAKYRDSSSRLILMRNMLLDETYFTKEDKKQAKNLDQKVKDSNITLRYKRQAASKGGAFAKFGDENLKNLVLQRVDIVAPGVRTESIVCFFYKPAQPKGS